MRRFAPERLLPFAVLAGALLLIGSQFTSVFELQSAGDVTQATVSAADQHWYSIGLLGVVAIFAAVGAIYTGSRPLAAAVFAIGVVSLLLFLIIDLPEAGRADSVRDTAESLVVAEAHPTDGFWTELIGALVLTVCGGAMATLTGEQLRALRPGASAKSRRSLPSNRPAAESTWKDTDKPPTEERPSRRMRKGVKPAEKEGSDAPVWGAKRTKKPGAETKASRPKSKAPSKPKPKPKAAAGSTAARKADAGSTAARKPKPARGSNGKAKPSDEGDEDGGASEEKRDAYQR